MILQRESMELVTHTVLDITKIKITNILSKDDEVENI